MLSVPEMAQKASINLSVFLCPVSPTELRLALEVPARHGIHAGLPLLSGLPQLGDYLWTVTHREQHPVTGQLRASPTAPDRLVPLI